MGRIILTFERYKQFRLRIKRRKKRMEDDKRIPPKPMEGEPVNPDLAILTPEV
jgi:hypothetical protein